MNPDSPVTSLMEQHYLKKSLKESEMAILSVLKRPNLKIVSAPWLAPPGSGSLNSWNQWMNDQPLYQSLFRPLIRKYLSLRLILKSDIDSQYYVHLPFCSFTILLIYHLDLGGWDSFWKERRTKKWRHWFWNRGFIQFLLTCNGD